MFFVVVVIFVVMVNLDIEACPALETASGF